MNQIWITGDTHADISRFNTEIFPEQKDLDKSDVINFAVHYYDEDDLAIDKVSKEAVKQVTEAAQVDVPDMSQFDFDMF